MVTDMSQVANTGVTTVVLLVAELPAVADEFAVMLAAVTDAARFTTTMMSAELLAAMLEVSLQTTEVVTVQDHPAGAETETYVVLAGIASVNAGVVAAAGPLLVMVCV